MKNTKKKHDSLSTDKLSRQSVLKIQLNGLQLEITSQNEQYSLVELNALLNILAENKNHLLEVSCSGSPLSAPIPYENSKDLLRHYTPGGVFSRFSRVRQNHDAESNEFQWKY